MICLYGSNETVFTSNGLVVLSDAISCMITEELNGVYELDLEYPLDERGKWKYLLENNIIKADGQLFRIYHKFKSLASMKVNARHIFYDLLENILEDVRPTGLSGYGALDWILTRTQYAHPFTSMGDVGGINTKYFVRKNPVDAIMGADGILSIWGGELVRDNFLIKLLGARGLDRGVLIAYGKNIQGIEETLDTSGICTRLMPVGKDGILLAEKYIDSPYISNYPNPKIKVVDFSDCETEVTLRTAGMAYMLSAKIDIPQFNYKIDFLELSKTEEYKGYAVLEKVYEGDTVTIRHSKLGIDLKAKVIKTTFNDITKRLEKVELGSFKPNLATGINNAIQEVRKEITNNNSFLELAIENATTLLTTALGGYVVKRDGELLIMDTEDPMTATKVWRWNVNGLGYSSTGINGPYGLAMTMDGHIVANFVDTGVLNANLIKAGILKSFNNLSWINMETGTFNLAGKVTFDGTTFAINAAAVKLAVGQIGGNNLFKDGSFELGYNVSRITGPWSSIAVYTTLSGGAHLPYEGDYFLFCVASAPTTVYVYANFTQQVPVRPLKKHTISYFYKWGTAGTIVSHRNSVIYYDVNGVYLTENVLPALSNVLNTATFTPPANTAYVVLRFGYQVAVTGSYSWIYLDAIKIEEGDYATAWSPAPGDSPDNSNIISAINLSPESATIAAEHVDIHGNTIDLSANTSVKLAIGATTCFEVTSAHARFKAADGSYTEFVPASTGLTWHKAGVAKDYHYLSVIGSGVVNPSSTVTVTLPVEYRGKAFSVLISTGGAAWVSSQNNAAGTFNVTELLGYTTSFTYIAIA